MLIIFKKTNYVYNKKNLKNYLDIPLTKYSFYYNRTFNNKYIFIKSDTFSFNKNYLINQYNFIKNNNLYLSSLKNNLNYNIQDFNNNKILTFKKNISFYKNIILNQYDVSNNYHKNLKFKKLNIKKKSYLLSNNLFKLNNIINFYASKYKINNLNLFKGIYKSIYKNINSFNKLKDITSDLIIIENIFESKILNDKLLIANKIGFLENIFYYYDKHITNYMWFYKLFNLEKNQILYYSNNTSLNTSLYVQPTSILNPKNIMSNGLYSNNFLISKIYLNSLKYFNQEKSCIISHIYIYNSILESLINHYLKNGIIISSIQFEIIIKKMTTFVKINYSGDSSLIENDILNFNLIASLNYSFKYFNYSQILYTPTILGISKSNMASAGFLSSISFQEIIKNLIYLSVYNKTDWLTDLKSKIITTDLILSGSGWYRHFLK